MTEWVDTFAFFNDDGVDYEGMNVTPKNYEPYNFSFRVSELLWYADTGDSTTSIKLITEEETIIIGMKYEDLRQKINQ